MKKSIFVLLVLMIAGQVMAENVVITVVDDGNGIASLNYTSDVNVRAFALLVDVNGASANINDVNQYFEGDCNATKKGFGIFMDTINGIDINDAGVVQDWGSPIADSCSPGAAGTGIGTDKVVLGMGALYEDGNQPSLSGTLCKIQVTANCTICVFEEETYRGGVVLEDGNGTDANLTGACGVSITVVPDCYVGQADYSEYEAAGKPECWCYLRQCHGDADGLKQGSAKTGYTYVDTDDLDIMSAGWQKKEPPKGSGILGLTVNGVPVACADFAHNKQGSAKTGYTRVDTDDLDLMSAYWQEKEPPKGSGTPADCSPGNRTP
jgi:hypothetical protein